MSRPIDDRYLEWLYSQFGAVRNRNPSRSYWNLAKQLYTKEFVWFVPNDDNRILDGKELRYEFLKETDEVDPAWMNLGCSMLEMLVALARRAAFESSEPPAHWFRVFLANMKVDAYTDDVYDQDIAQEVEEALDKVIYRNYRKNGVGGLFPLRKTFTDQRKVELWYQLAAYILEGS